MQTGHQSPVDRISTKRFYGKLDVTENKTPCKLSHNKGIKNKKKPVEKEIDSLIAQTVEMKGINKKMNWIKINTFVFMRGPIGTVHSA